MATIGTSLTIGPVAGGQTIGVLLGLAAASSYALYIVLSSAATAGVGPLSTSAVVMAACGIVYDALALATGASLPTSAGAWTALAGVTVLSTVEPVVSVAVAAVALGDTLSPIQLAGGALVVAAVGVLARTSPVPPLDAPALDVS